MIRTISIHRHKSFHPTNEHSVQIPNKTATYVYGLNGAGKSAIGEVVDGLARNNAAFAHCRIDTTDNARYRYVVYNHHYVERLIGQPIQGIFTVGEVDTVRQQRIQDIETRNRDLEGLIAGATTSVSTAEGNIAKEFVRAKDDIWKAHEWGKKTALASVLEGYGRNKEKFFTDLRTHVLPEDGQLDSIERLEKRWGDVSGTESERASVSLDTTALSRIENTSSKYAALDRFVDRGSHRDAINGPPIDWTDYDVPYLLGKFRAMFNEIGQEPHYLMKMGEDAPEPAHD